MNKTVKNGILALVLACCAVFGSSNAAAKSFTGFERGMGIGGWLTNYKRFNVLPEKWRLPLSVGDFEHFDTYITEADVKNIAEMGLDHIRLGFDQIVIEEKPGIYRERIFKNIDRFIGWCEKYKINVVLNMHKAVGNYCDISEKVQLLDNAALQDRFVNVWLAFEDRYHDRPGVAFELLNEVRNVDPKKWNELAERTLKAIRAKNASRLVVIGSTCWNGAHTLKDLKLYDDPNVVYTFHMYGPFEFTHQRGVLQKQPLYYNRNMAYPSDIEPYRDFQRYVNAATNPYPNQTRMDKNFIRRCLQPAFDFAKAHPDKILWCGEFGTIRHAKIEYRENWMRDVISLLKENNISYCVWNYLSTPNDGNRFSLVDDDTRKILSSEMLRIIQGRVNDPQQKGKPQMNEKEVILVAADPFAVGLKQAIVAHLEKRGFTVRDLGATKDQPQKPYFESAEALCRAMQAGEAKRAFLFCGTGMGMNMIANRFKGVRAAVVESVYAAKMCRTINDANVLCMGQMLWGEMMATAAADAFLDTAFTQGLEPLAPFLKEAREKVEAIRD